MADRIRVVKAIQEGVPPLAVHRNGSRLACLAKVVMVRGLYGHWSATTTRASSMGQGFECQRACGRTRKAVNYALPCLSHGKPWWRAVPVLTCKSFVRVTYRGERLIERPSSWFPSKFPSGSL